MMSAYFIVCGFPLFAFPFCLFSLFRLSVFAFPFWLFCLSVLAVFVFPFVCFAVYAACFSEAARYNVVAKIVKIRKNSADMVVNMTFPWFKKHKTPDSLREPGADVLLDFVVPPGNEFHF